MRFDVHPFKDVEAARVWGRLQIDEAAGAARSRFITATPGQDAVYRAKYDEARALIAAGDVPGVVATPWIDAEAECSRITRAAAAERIKRQGDLWNLVQGPRIEAYRVGGKDGLAALQSVGEVVRSTRCVLGQLEAIEGGDLDR